MRILLLTDPAPDYLADLLYIGLCRVLGNDRVIDFPLKMAYHQPERRVYYIPQVPAHSFHEEDILAMVRYRQFELAVLSSPRAGVKAIVRSCNRTASSLKGIH